MISKKLEYFLIPYYLFFLVILATIVQYPKAELHLLMNSNHTPFADWFFKIWTEFGGNIIPFVFVFLLLFYRFSYALYFLSAKLLGVVIFYGAKLLFAELRPLYYFKEHFPDIKLQTVEGIRMLNDYSFPSGHTTTAFALFFGLALIVNKKWLNVLFFITAALVGYSRVYLSQHFAIDILVGSAIGIFSAWVCYPLLGKMDKKWGKKSLTDSILKKNQVLVAKNQK